MAEMAIDDGWGMRRDVALMAIDDWGMRRDVAEMAIDDRWGPSHSCGLERSTAERVQAISYDLCRNQRQLTTGNVVALTMSCRVVEAMSTGVNACNCMSMKQTQHELTPQDKN